MNAVKLTERSIKGLPNPSEGNKVTWDSELSGFGIRITRNGARSFILNYRNQTGIQRRLTIGRFPTLSATAARRRARALKAKVELGGDPLEAKRTRRGEVSFAELVDLFSSRLLVKQKRGYEPERLLRRDAIPRFGARTKAVDVRRRDVIHLVQEKAVTAPVAANRLLGAIRRLYNWAIEQDILESNPTTLIKRPGVEKSRDRVLSDDEIAEFWEKLPSTRRMSEGVRVALRLMLLTAQRPGEFCSMEWDDLDLKSGWWTIPREKTKGDRAHRVPLSHLALEVLAGWPRDGSWVFPSRQGQPLKVITLSHAVRFNREHFGFPAFTPHDLRRTVASQLGSLGVDRLVISKVLSHAEGGVTAVYDRHSYDQAKRVALTRWEGKLQSILTGETIRKVVPIG